jgi:hypothetical protein
MLLYGLVYGISSVIILDQKGYSSVKEMLPSLFSYVVRVYILGLLF